MKLSALYLTELAVQFAKMPPICSTVWLYYTPVASGSILPYHSHNLYKQILHMYKESVDNGQDFDIKSVVVSVYDLFVV